jgi:hypothetical protein
MGLRIGRSLEPPELFEYARLLPLPPPEPPEPPRPRLCGLPRTPFMLRLLEDVVLLKLVSEFFSLYFKVVGSCWCRDDR